MDKKIRKEVCANCPYDPQNNKLFVAAKCKEANYFFETLHEKQCDCLENSKFLCKGKQRHQNSYIVPKKKDNEILLKQIRMKIIIKPKYVECDGFEFNKTKAKKAIFVKNEAAKERLLNYLLTENKAWQYYEHLIQIAPKYINDLSDLNSKCFECNLPIIDINAIKKRVSFILYFKK